MREAPAEQLLQRICVWAESQQNIRAIVMMGSYARGRADELSDLDIEIFARDTKSYLTSGFWMSEIGPVIVYLSLHNDLGSPTRLVIFRDGLKVDFTISPASVLASIVDGRKLPPLYDHGYRVLVDKDQLAGRLPAASLRSPLTRVPTEQEFNDVAQEFWFEAYHVAKYLRRDDLWAVKFRDWNLKELLLKMLEWSEKSLHGWDYETGDHGIRIREWTDPSVLARLGGVFARFDAADSWRALQTTIDVFRDIAQDTAGRLRYHYPEEVDHQLSDYVASLASL